MTTYDTSGRTSLRPIPPARSISRCDILPLSHKYGNVWTLIVRVCKLFRSSYSWVRWKDEAPMKLMQKKKKIKS